MERLNVFVLEPARVFLVRAGELLPQVVLAIVVVLIGWVLARMTRFAVAKALRAFNFNVLTERAGVDGFLRDGGIRLDAVQIVAIVCSWLVLVAAVMVAFNALGLPAVTDLVGRVLLFLPRVLVALLVVILGAYFARFIRDAVSAHARGAHLQDAELLGRIAQYAIVTFAVLIALDQMNVGGEIVRQTFLIVLAGVVFGLALAFGLGGKDWAAALLERWWPRKR